MILKRVNSLEALLEEALKQNTEKKIANYAEAKAEVDYRDDEAWKSDEACGGPSVSENVAVKADANLLTYSRQKLAEISCNYNPKCCGHCEDVLIPHAIVLCKRCELASYCSHKCR